MPKVSDHLDKLRLERDQRTLGMSHTSSDGTTTASVVSEIPKMPGLVAPAVTLADVVSAVDRLSAATLAAATLEPGATSAEIAEAFDTALVVVSDY